MLPSQLGRLVLAGLALAAACGRPAEAQPEPAAAPPNLVILFADDLGWGDLGSYGSASIRTPRLDRMAAEGLRFTQFYSAAEVCTPSRAALLTGRLPIRNGMASDRRRVLFPDSARGLPLEEITLAEALKTRGYATACVGKWHLGHLPTYLPTRQGFDLYLGIPYSNDMDHVAGAPPRESWGSHPEVTNFNVPLLSGEAVVERPAEQHTLTRRYTDAAVEFIAANRSRPFFLYLPYTMPHVPLFASDGFAGTSPRGLYGDVVEEIDASVGRVLDTLRALGLAERTLVFFTSDNGPWLLMGEQGGSAGPLYEGKGSTWEGGMREPAIAWWPGRVGAGRVSDGLASTLDLFVTALALAGVPAPTDRVIDGVDLAPLLFDTGPSRREVMFFYRGEQLYAVRQGWWKAHLKTKSGYGPDPVVVHDPPALYHLGRDPGERFDVATEHPEVVAELRAEVERHLATVVPVESNLDARIGGPTSR